MTGPSVEIRPALLADVPELAALAQRVWADAFSDGVSAEDMAADVAQRRSEAVFTAMLAEHDVLLAWQGVRMVGYAMCGVVDPDITQATVADRELHRLYVETGLQRSGVGSALLRAALELPQMAAAPRVFLTVWGQNAPAIALYERFGFTIVGAVDYRIGTHVMQDAVMMRPRPVRAPTGWRAR